MRAITLAVIGTVALGAVSSEAREKSGYVGKLSRVYYGKCSWFDATAEEHVAIKRPTSTWYVACRWDYDELARQFGCNRREVKSRLAQCKVLIRAINRYPYHIEWYVAEVCDWGPGKRSRMIDLSRDLFRSLAVKTDDLVEFRLEAEGEEDDD